MRRLTMIAAMVLGAAAMLAIPSSALAGTVNDCAYAASGQTVPVGTGTVTVYDSGGGPSGKANVAAGVCADNMAPAQGFDGGHVDVGAGNGADPTQAYAVVDGDNENVDPGSTSPDNSSSDGYIGASNFESGASKDANCSDGPDQGAAGSTNSGGCVGFDPAVPVVGGTYAPIPLFVCGNTSGDNWASTARDGCSLP